jgi:DNA-binding protein Alba|tara:strand:- start:309 stop:617 length:309 start_codon:yes stop_codon:yes gene_type:complete
MVTLGIKMFKSTIDYTIEKFLITNEPVMNLAIDVLQILNKIGKITIKGKGESCPATVSVANIITQNMLSGRSKTEKISVSSETLDDGRLISTIEIIIIKISG